MTGTGTIISRVRTNAFKRVSEENACANQAHQSGHHSDHHTRSPLLAPRRTKRRGTSHSQKDSRSAAQSRRRVRIWCNRTCPSKRIISDSAKCLVMTFVARYLRGLTIGLADSLSDAITNHPLSLRSGAPVRRIRCRSRASVRYAGFAWTASGDQTWRRIHGAAQHTAEPDSSRTPSAAPPRIPRRYTKWPGNPHHNFKK